MLGVRTGRRTLEAPATEPWLGRRDWAQGRANGESGASLALAWVGVVCWNAVTFAGAYVLLRDPAARASPAILVAVLPAAGLGLLFWVVRASLRRARFGHTFVRLDAIPVPLGRTFSGTLEAPVPAHSGNVLRLTFGCVNRITTGSGKSRSSFEHIRWQDEQTLALADLPRGPRGTTVVPVRFEVPRDLRPSDDSSPADTIRWLLRARAEVPGIDFDEVYEIPVFETTESPSLEAWTVSAGARQVRDLQPPLRHTVTVSTTPGGGSAYDFPAGRNPGLAAGVTGFAVVFGAVECFLLLHGAPLLFPIVFGLAVALLAGSALRLWFTRSRVVVEQDRLTVESSTLGVRRRRSWSRDGIRHLRCRIGMQSGQGGRGVVYYDIVVGDSSGRDRAVATALRDQHEAEWIVVQLRRALRLPDEPLRETPVDPSFGHR